MSSITYTRRTTTVGAFLIEPRRLELRERELPAVGPTDVLVDITACGICTSDIDFWLGRSDRQTPAPLGHEPAGIVAEVGSEVSLVKPGDRVACWVEGGGFSQALVIDEKYCMPVGDNCRQPALAEPLACVVNTVGLAAPSLAEDVVIVGGGFMGNLLQVVLRLRGPRTVTVADVRLDALERAQRLGATHTVDTSADDLVRRVAEITEGRGADISFEVTGVSAGLELAASATRMSGKVCIVGYHQGGMREIPLGRWNWMAFDIVNAHFREERTILSGMRTGLRLMEAKLLDLDDLVTHVYPLERIEEAFETAAAKPDGFVKGMVEPRSAAVA
jgi:L-iditol 2-dehydrogenase